MVESVPKRFSSTPHQGRFSPSRPNPESGGLPVGEVGEEGDHQRQLGNRTRSKASGGGRRHSLTQNGGAAAEAGAPEGAPHAPRGPAGRPQLHARRGPGRRAWACAAAESAGRPATGGLRRLGVGRGSAGLSPRPPPGTGSALTSDAPRETLEPGKGGGAAGMNGAR